MAHDVRTARRYYHVHGIGVGVKRVGGISALNKTRGERPPLLERRVEDSSSNEDDSDTDSEPQSPRALHPPAGGDSQRHAAGGAANKEDAATAEARRRNGGCRLRRAAGLLDNNRDPASHPRDRGHGWTGAYSAEVLFKDPAVKAGFAGKTPEQVYNKYEYVRRCFLKL